MSCQKAYDRKNKRNIKDRKETTKENRGNKTLRFFLVEEMYRHNDEQELEALELRYKLKLEIEQL